MGMGSNQWVLGYTYSWLRIYGLIMPSSL